MSSELLLRYVQCNGPSLVWVPRWLNVGFDVRACISVIRKVDRHGDG